MPSTARLKKVLFEAAEAARDILLRHYGKIDAVIHKGVIDLVTVADRESEAAIIERIQSAFPGHAVLGEESGAVAPRSKAGRGRPEFCWVIDPLDGTTNFAHSVPIFSVSIAVQQAGETVLGLVVDPLRDEWFFARKGGGATLNGKRIRVSEHRKLADSLVITGFPHDRREQAARILQGVEAMIMQTRGVLRLGSAAIDLSWVACGRGDAFYEPQLCAWDFAAGALLVQEAGGRCTNFKGRAVRLSDRRILASNGLVHRELAATLRRYWND